MAHFDELFKHLKEQHRCKITRINPKSPTRRLKRNFTQKRTENLWQVSDLHRRILTRILQTLEHHFTQRPDVYVSGDILVYYTEGHPQKVVAPDVLVTFGIGQKPRLTYKVWEEGKVPDFVMELSSKSTYQNDLGEKMELYASLGIRDYVVV